MCRVLKYNTVYKEARMHICFTDAINRLGLDPTKSKKFLMHVADPKSTIYMVYLFV